jgi:hypothetical protein
MINDSDNLPLAFRKLTDFIKTKFELKSLAQIANSINISPSYLSSMRSSKSNTANSSRFDYLLKICRKYNLTITDENNSLEIINGFDKEKFSTQYIMIFWNETINKIRFIKFYYYNFGGLGSMEFEELVSKKEFFLIDNHSNTKIVFNEELDEYYKIGSFEIPGFRSFFHSEDEQEVEFYLGKEISKNYLGSLFIGFSIDFLEIVLSNLDFFQLFLTNKDLQETITSSIHTFNELLSFIQFFNTKKRKFTIKLPKTLNRILHQFLNYFTEFVEKTKGQKIRLNIINHDSFLEIEIEANIEKNITKILDYLEEYFNLLNQDINSLKIDIETNISSSDFDILILDLKQQINHLKNSLEIASVKNKHLGEEVAFLRSIVKEMATSNLSEPKLKDQEELDKKNLCLNLLSRNRIEECISNLFNILENHGSQKEVILQSSKYNENEKNKRLGIIKDDDFSTNRNKIVNALTDIIQNEL